MASALQRLNTSGVEVAGTVAGMTLSVGTSITMFGLLRRIMSPGLAALFAPALGAGLNVFGVEMATRSQPPGSFSQSYSAGAVAGAALLYLNKIIGAISNPGSEGIGKIAIPEFGVPTGFARGKPVLIDPGYERTNSARVNSATEGSGSPGSRMNESSKPVGSTPAKMPRL